MSKIICLRLKQKQIAFLVTFMDSTTFVIGYYFNQGGKEHEEKLRQP